MNTPLARSVRVLLVAGLPLSCASFSESASADTMTANVGVYAPPPPGLQRVRLGVPKFEVASGVAGEAATLAADQMTTLSMQTRRFAVIERAQIEQLLKEQALAGVVEASERAAKGKIRGVDYLLLGKITNLRVKQGKAKSGFDLARVPIPGVSRGLGAFDYTKRTSMIQIDCGVDLRLVDAQTGEIAAADFAEYSRTDTIGSFGISVLGVGASADADLRIDADNRGKILRLALDHAIRKMLPMIDNHLVNAATRQQVPQPAKK